MAFNLPRAISAFFLAPSHRLYQKRQALFLSSIADAPPAALVVNAQSDPEHVAALLDALETNGGYRSVTILDFSATDQPGGAAAPEYETNLAVRSETVRWEETALETMKSFGGDVFFLSMHPYEESPPAVRRLILLLLGAARPLTGRPFIYYRDLTLVSGTRRAYLRKRILELALAAVGQVLGWSLPRTFEKIVRFPASDPGAVCRHERRVRVFSRPRVVDFCPACGMGLTPAAEIHPALDSMYDISYALYGRFTGRKEYRKFQAHHTERILGYLEELRVEELLRPGDRVLDFGCGNGIYCKLFEKFGVDYWGYDSSEAATAIAANLNDDAPRVRFTSERIELDAAGGFSAILLSHVMEHVADTRGLLDEVASLCLPGALLLIEVPNARTYTWSMEHYGFANEQHVWDFTAAQLCLILRERGWEVLKSVEHEESALPFLFIAARVGEKVVNRAA